MPQNASVHDFSVCIESGLMVWEAFWCFIDLSISEVAATFVDRVGIYYNATMRVLQMEQHKVPCH